MLNRANMAKDNLWIAVDSEIKDSDFDEARHCLLTTYHTYVQKSCWLFNCDIHRQGSV